MAPGDTLALRLKTVKNPSVDAADPVRGRAPTDSGQYSAREQENVHAWNGYLSQSALQ